MKYKSLIQARNDHAVDGSGAAGSICKGTIVLPAGTLRCWKPKFSSYMATGAVGDRRLVGRIPAVQVRCTR